MQPLLKDTLLGLVPGWKPVFHIIKAPSYTSTKKVLVLKYIHIYIYAFFLRLLRGIKDICLPMPVWDSLPEGRWDLTINGIRYWPVLIFFRNFMYTKFTLECSSKSSTLFLSSIPPGLSSAGVLEPGGGGTATFLTFGGSKTRGVPLPNAHPCQRHTHPAWTAIFSLPSGTSDKGWVQALRAVNFFFFLALKYLGLRVNSYLAPSTLVSTPLVSFRLSGAYKKRRNVNPL
jgi:hypothetical protein